MTTTLVERGVQRMDFRDVAAHLRTNAGIDRRDDVAAVRPVAAFGAAARRLRASNTFETDNIAIIDSSSHRLATVVTSSAGRLRAHARNRELAAEQDLYRRVGTLAQRSSDLLETIQAAKTGRPKRANRTVVTRVERVERVVHIERVVRVEHVARVVRPAPTAVAPSAAPAVPVVPIVPIEGPKRTLGAVPAPAGRVSAPAAYDVNGPLQNTAQFGAAARRLRAAYDAEDRVALRFTY